MNEDSPPQRSPLLLQRDRSVLLLVDVQEKLLPFIPARQRLLYNWTRLLRGAALLDVPIHVSEQYPKGLGATVSELEAFVPPERFTKTMFSCRGCDGLSRQWSDSGRNQVLLAGLESHVCIQQTCLDLLAAGFDPFLCVDAVGARYDIDHDTAIRRMESCGATLLTTEAALFEWCEDANAAEFKDVQRLILLPEED